jgi:hypothetical protein
VGINPDEGVIYLSDATESRVWRVHDRGFPQQMWPCLVAMVREAYISGRNLRDILLAINLQWVNRNMNLEPTSIAMRNILRLAARG